MSDIVGEGMSLNKGQKDIPVTPEEDEAWDEIPLRNWSDPEEWVVKGPLKKDSDE